MTNRLKVLFILKDRNSYGVKRISYGLVNSSTFVANVLRSHGIKAEVVTVNDNNDIDRVVTECRPTHVFIEALWVVPEKFKILAKLHPKVKWNVRLHSKLPFLATESIAIEWVKEYLRISQSHKVDLTVSVNNRETYIEMHQLFGSGIKYLPNIYAPETLAPYHNPFKHSHELNIGCFGALRPLKNTLQQAVWSIFIAEKVNKELLFHVNHTMEENSQTQPVYENLVALFKDTKHKLVTHDWLPHDQFLTLVAEMDLGLQLSFTESFNIVTADFVYSGVPILVSKDIDWLPEISKADPTNFIEVLNKVYTIFKDDGVVAKTQNKIFLGVYNYEATEEWLEYLKVH